jgi:hypothetical protein
MSERLPTITPQELARKERVARNESGKPSGKGCGCGAFGLFGVIMFMIAGMLIALFLTGRDFGLIGTRANLKERVAFSQRSPLLRFNSIVPKAVHEYSFYATQGVPLQVSVQFPLAQKSPARQVKFYDTDGGLLTYGELVPGSRNTVQIAFMSLPNTGIYRVVITGADDSAQGFYSMTMLTYEASNFPSR